MKTLPGSRERVDIGPVGGSIGAFIGPAMMSAAFARAPWPSLQRLPAWIEGPSGRHSTGVLQDSDGTTIAAALSMAPLSRLPFAGKHTLFGRWAGEFLQFLLNLF